jgi:uncharacterized membrane protein YecN with MAPEG domain
MPAATVLFASLLTLLYLYLTREVIRRRRAYRVAYGSPEDHPDLQRAIRAHGNFQEYTPLFLIMLYLLETSTGMTWLCYVFGLIFFCGRLSHAYSLHVAEARGLASGARASVTFRFRFYAMAQTLTTLGVMAGLLLFQFAMQAIG